jgi:O-antigen/teichoic acid export membrane protein
VTDLQSLVRGSRRGAAAAMITRGIDVIATYGFYALLARALTIADFGRFVLALTLAQFAASLARRGIDQVLVALPASGGLNRAVARSIGGAGIVIALLAALALRFTGLTPFAYWLAAAVPLIALAQFVTNALRARGSVMTAAVAEGIAQPVTALIGAAVVAMTSASPIDFAFAFAASWIAPLVFAAAVDWSGAKIAREAAADLHARGRSMLGAFLLSQAALSADVLLLGLLASASEVARYAAAQKITTAFILLQGVVTWSAAPYIRNAARDAKLLREYLQIVTRWTLLVSLPLLIATLAMPELVLRLVFGAEYATLAVLPLAILSLARMALVMSGPAGSVLLCTGHEKVMLRSQLAGTLILILGVAAVANRGAVAVATAVCIGAWITRGLLLVMMRRFAGVAPFDRLILRDAALAAAAVVVVRAAYYALG